MANLRKYKRLRKKGYTILGLYKEAKEDGMMPHDIVAMLEKILPYGDDSFKDGNHEDCIKFMRRMEFGEEDCMTCQKLFVGEPGEWCPNNCPECQDRIDKMWEKVYDAQEADMDEDEMLTAGILIGVLAAIKAP